MERNYQFQCNKNQLQSHEAGAELRSRLSLQLGAAPLFKGAELLTPAVKRDQAADETCCTPGITQ